MTPLDASWKLAPDAGRRALVTAGALVLFLVGRQIPLPLLADGAASRLFPHSLDAGTSARLSVFALGVVPIYSSLLLFAFAEIFVPPVGRWANAGPGNRRWMNGSARVLALVFAAFQASQIGASLQGVRWRGRGARLAVPHRVDLHPDRRHRVFVLADRPDRAAGSGRRFHGAAGGGISVALAGEGAKFQRRCATCS